MSTAARAEGAVEALREAADDWQQGGWAEVLPSQSVDRTELILGIAQRTGNWLRDRADRIEADQ